LNQIVHLLVPSENLNRRGKGFPNFGGNRWGMIAQVRPGAEARKTNRVNSANESAELKETAEEMWAQRVLAAALC
jgi:hypothetical protein